MRTETGSRRGGVEVVLGCRTHRNGAKRGGGDVGDETLVPAISASIGLGFWARGTAAERGFIWGRRGAIYSRFNNGF